MPVISKVDCRVACQLAVPPKVPGWPVCVYTGTGRVSTSRLFDYEWSMLRQQNAQRTTSDTEQRANSDLAWSSLAVIPWLTPISLRQPPAYLLPRTELSPEATWGGFSTGSIKHTWLSKLLKQTQASSPETITELTNISKTEWIMYLLFKLSWVFTTLTSSPAVQVAAHPWHPDLEQRSLCEFFLLCGRVNSESHEAWVAGGGVSVSDWGVQLCDLCAYVCFTEYLLQVSWLLLRRSTW